MGSPIASGSSRSGLSLRSCRATVRDHPAERPLDTRALDRGPDPGGSVLHTRAGEPGQGKRRESATDVRLDGDEMAADADDGDAGHATRRYMG
jgi:hypothetical protein